MSDFPSFSLPVTTSAAANADGSCHLFLLRDSIILMLRVRQKSVAGHEYARLNIGANITRENSENGALPIREGEQARKQRKQKPPGGEARRLIVKCCAPADQSNRRTDLQGYAAWEIHPVMELQIVR